MELQQELNGQLTEAQENTSGTNFQAETEERLQKINQLLWQEFNESTPGFPLWGMWK